MTPLEFEGQNVVFAKDQPEYQPLPAKRTAAGEVTTCWALTWRERLSLLFGGRLWISILTFNGPLQPMLPRIGRRPLEELLPEVTDIRRKEARP